jgi:hypothetical protein
MPELLTRKAASVPGRIVFLAGGALILGSAYIHFHLWQSVGYKHLPTIGPLFLLQWIGGIVVGLAVIALPRLWVALGGIGFALSTMAGFLLTTALPKGLFNFKESWLAPYAHEAFYIEIAIVVVLAVAGAFCLSGSASSSKAGSTPPVAATPGA